MLRRTVLALTGLILAALTASGAQAAPNGTCLANDNSGSALPEKNLIVAKLTAADFGLADIECRFDTTYTINARLELQAYRGGSWVTFCSSTFGADSNAAGVAVATTFLVCQYPDMIGGEYHRSQLSYSTTADGIERQSYSASWYVQPG